MDFNDYTNRIEWFIKMKSNNIKLPLNRMFGFFFSGIFFCLFLYFYLNSLFIQSYIFGLLSFSFFVIAIVKSDLLLPFNKLWMTLGLILGSIITPIILGIIFFGVFTPIAIFMRLFGRDELRLKFKKRASYWIKRETITEANSFKNQF